MKITTLVVGPLATNCYLVSEDGQALVIDPGDDLQTIMAAVADGPSTVKAVVLTHAHWDHLGVALDISTAAKCWLCLHPLDLRLLENPLYNLSGYFAAGDFSPGKTNCFLEDEQKLSVGGLDVKVLHTPGHTPGSICLLAGENLFSGDLIFRESVGRTDLPGGNTDQLLASIREKVMALPDSVTIYPGHGPRTSVGWERAHNPYL